MIGGLRLVNGGVIIINMSGEYNLENLEEAYDDGYQAGFDDGYESGTDEAQENLCDEWKTIFKKMMPDSPHSHHREAILKVVNPEGNVYDQLNNVFCLLSKNPYWFLTLDKQVIN